MFLHLVLNNETMGMDRAEDLRVSLGLARGTRKLLALLSKCSNDVT